MLFNYLTHWRHMHSYNMCIYMYSIFCIYWHMLQGLADGPQCEDSANLLKEVRPDELIQWRRRPCIRQRPSHSSHARETTHAIATAVAENPPPAGVRQFPHSSCCPSIGGARRSQKRASFVGLQASTLGHHGGAALLFCVPVFL